jgi:hypothetical protein
LHRRIPSQALLETEVLALITQRAEKKIKITWQFSIQTARSKFNAHYTAAHPDNAAYQFS